MRALWLNLKNNSARWGFLPLTILGIAVLFGRNRFWIGIWPESGAAAQVGAYFLSIFAAGSAAWVAASVELRGLSEQAMSAAIRPIKVELTRFSATLLWLIAPYLVVSASAFVATAVTLFPQGWLSFLMYILLGTALIVFGASWGWLVGKLLSPLVAALCAALSWFIGMSLLGSVTQLVRQSGPPWIEVQSTPVILRLTVILAFAAIVCALPSRVARPVLFGQRVAVSVAALVGVVAVHLTTVVADQRPPAAKPLCLQKTIEYCLWPEHAKYAPMIEAIDQQIAMLPVDLPLPDRVVDYALSGSTKWSDDRTAIEVPGKFDPEFDISEGSRWALARGVARAIMGTVFAECRPDAAPDPERRMEQMFAWLEWRLADSGGPDYRTNAPASLQTAWSTGRLAAAGKSDQDQGIWVSAIVADVKKHHCRAA
ncbi:hypothetical protein [Salinispora oceanensis]|uniref:hypothetical protein n=1 Tax=Salinispora oceanensis TaxID=1050199 RepID=UPI0013A59C2C|nr:hypothetical protein [Salinispora oceanensis]